MKNASKRRWLWPAILAGAMLCLLLCCGGFGYVGYRSVHTIAETYEPATLPTVEGVNINIDVRPQKRINDGYGDRLVGPPYELMISLRDPRGKMTRASLHSVRVVPSGGDEFSVPVTNGDNPVSEFGVVALYARVEHESLGTDPRLVADIELIRPDGSMREEVTFSLRRGSRPSLNIP